MTEFEIATLELQRWSIYVAAGVGVAQCALIGYWIYIMHMASRHRDRGLDNQTKSLNALLERTGAYTKSLEATLARTEGSWKALIERVESGTKATNALIERTEASTKALIERVENGAKATDTLIERTEDSARALRKLLEKTP